MIKRLIGCLLLLCGLLTILFIRGYHGNMIHFPLLIWVLGAVIFSIGGYILYRTPSRAESALNIQIQKEIRELKSVGQETMIPFSNCEIVEYEALQKQEYAYYLNNACSLEKKIENLNELKSRSSDGGEAAIKSIITYALQDNRTGLFKKYISRAIPIDKITLQF